MCNVNDDENDSRQVLVQSIWRLEIHGILVHFQLPFKRVRDYRIFTQSIHLAELLRKKYQPGLTSLPRVGPCSQ